MTKKHMSFSDWMKSTARAGDLLDAQGYQMFKAGHNDGKKRKAEKRMDWIDGLPRDCRLLVHEFDYAVIRAFIDHGIDNPKTIKHLIQFVRGYYADGRATVTPNRGQNRYSTERATERAA